MKIGLPVHRLVNSPDQTPRDGTDICLVLCLGICTEEASQSSLHQAVLVLRFSSYAEGHNRC